MKDPCLSSFMEAFHETLGSDLYAAWCRKAVVCRSFAISGSVYANMSLSGRAALHLTCDLWWPRFNYTEPIEAKYCGRSLGRNLEH